MILASLFGFTLTFLVIGSIRQTLAERDRFARENQRTREALIEREMRMDAILTTVADAIVTIDDEGTIMTFNPAAASIFGYTPEESVGRNIKTLMRSNDRINHNKFIGDYVEAWATQLSTDPNAPPAANARQEHQRCGNLGQPAGDRRTS